MKIAVFHELDFGGAKRVVLEFAKRLKENNVVDIYYVDSKIDNNLKDFSTSNYWYRFNSKVWKGNNWKVRLNKDTVELFKLYRLHKKVAFDIESRKYDYIFVHPSKFTQAPFLLRFLKNKCIYFCQEPLRIVYDKNLSNLSFVKFPKKAYEFFIRKIRKRIDLKNFNNAKLVLANSIFSKKLIEESYRKPVIVCYLGVDTNLFKPQKLNKSIDVLFIGNKDNGYTFLDELSKLNIDFKIRTVLRGSKKSNIADKELVRIYNKSKILIALNHNEPFGLIPLEAMACGVPVVAVFEGGYMETIVDGKTGYLVKRDYGRLEEAISKLLNNEKLRMKMGKEARSNIEKNWTWNKAVERFLEIIKNVT